MSETKVAVLAGVSRTGDIDVLCIGKISEIRALMPQARRMHKEYKEIVLFERPSSRESTRGDLPALPESED